MILPAACTSFLTIHATWIIKIPNHDYHSLYRSDIMIRVLDEGILSHSRERGAFIPTITPLSDGSFIAAQDVGSELGSRDHVIEVLRSKDGREWQSDGLLEFEYDDSGVSYQAVQIYEHSSSLWFMRCSRFLKKHLEKSGMPIPEEHPPAGPVIFWSHDRGISWSEPVFIEVDLPRDTYKYHTMGNVIFFSKDYWMFPIQLNNAIGYTESNHHGAAAIFTRDAGSSWGELAIVAQDPEGRIEYHDQFGIQLPDDQIYTMLWTVDTKANDDLNNHFVISKDFGHSWSAPQPVTLQGQVCAPILLDDGRVAAVYNYRHEPQGIRIGVSANQKDFSVSGNDYVFKAGTETMIDKPKDNHFLSKNAKIAFGRPNGIGLDDGTLLVWFWCTVNGVTHTRWARVAVDG